MSLLMRSLRSPSLSHSASLLTAALSHAPHAQQGLHAALQPAHAHFSSARTPEDEQTQERMRSSRDASTSHSSQPHGAHRQLMDPVEVIKKKLGMQLEGMRFQLPNSPFKKSRLGPPAEKLVLYRGRWMLPFRFLVFQLLGFMSTAAMLTTWASTTQTLTISDLAVGSSIIVGCVVTSYCIWFYSGRYVGELSLLLPSKRIARFSVLDFWGNREDNDIPVEQIEPPFLNRSIAEVKSIASQSLMPISVHGDRQYYISPRHGYLLQKDILNKLCYGKWLNELDGKLPPCSSTNMQTHAHEQTHIHEPSSRVQAAPLSGQGAVTDLSSDGEIKSCAQEQHDPAAAIGKGQGQGVAEQIDLSREQEGKTTKMGG